MIVTFDTRTQKEAALLVLTMCLHLGQVSSLKVKFPERQSTQQWNLSTVILTDATITFQVGNRLP